jgi:LysM repeat protein
MQPLRYDLKELANAVKYYFRKQGNETVESISKKFKVPVGTLNVHISNELKRKQKLKMENRSIIFQDRMITVYYNYEFHPGLMSHPDSIEFEFGSIIFKGRNITYLLSVESLNEIEEKILELEENDPSDDGPDPDYYYDMRKNGDI